MGNASKIMILFCFFLSSLALTAHAEPVMLSNGTNLSGSYNLSFPYGFNSTWINSSVGETITECNLTLDKPDGSVINYSMAPFGAPIRTCWITFSQDALGPAGNYNLTWSAKNSTDWVTNATFAFTINNASNPVHLYLNATLDDNNTYVYPNTINSTATSLGGTVYIYMNGNHTANGTAQASNSVLLGNGTYAYFVNSTGNQNYTDNSTGCVYYAFVNKGITSATLYLNGSTSSQTSTYPNSTINSTATSNVSGLYVRLWRNGTLITNTPSSATYINIQGAWDNNYTAQILGNENYSDSAPAMLWWNVSKAAVYPNLYLNGTEHNRNYNLYEFANFTTDLSLPGKTLSLTSNCSSWTNMSGAAPLTNTTNLTCSGLFFLNASWDGEENFTATNLTRYFDTIPPQYSIILPSSNIGMYVYNQTYWFNISVSAAYVKNVTFEFNETTRGISNVSNTGIYSFNVTDLPVGNYTYRWNITNSLGNNTTSGMLYYNVTKNTGALSYLTFSPGSVVFSGTATNITCTRSVSDPNVTMTLFRNGSSVGTGSSASNIIYDYNTGLSVGAYNYTCTIAESQNYTSYSTGSQYLTISSTSTTPTNQNSNTQTTTTGSFTILPSSSSVDMLPNASKTITLTLKNTLPNDLISINITVSGINSSWYTLDKTSITRLKHDVGIDTALLVITVPEGSNSSAYSIIVTAAGKDTGTNTKLTRQTIIALNVTNQTQNDVVLNETVMNTTVNNTVGQIDNTTNSATGLSIKPADLKYIVLIIGIIAIAFILFSRGYITSTLMKSYKNKILPKQTEEKHVEVKHEHKKESIISTIKKKICALRGCKVVIQVKKKEEKA